MADDSSQPTVTTPTLKSSFKNHFSCKKFTLSAITVIFVVLVYFSTLILVAIDETVSNAAISMFTTLMTFVGGITSLSLFGISMVDWKNATSIASSVTGDISKKVEVEVQKKLE